MSVKLSVELFGLCFKNPIIAASGTFGFAKEFFPWMDVGKLGGVSLKALTYEETIGNPPPRIVETASGILNSVGLQNPGVKAFKQEIWPKIKDTDTVLIANISGFSKEEYLKVIQELNEIDLDAYELNISCPNVHHGGAFFGRDAKMAYDIVKAAKEAAQKPLIVKLMPLLPSVADIAQAVQDGGADAVSLINTLPAMAIDAKRRRPILGNITGGLSGPAVKPVALKLVYETAKQLKIPVIGGGGVMTGEDAAEFLLAGASLVSVGTASVADPLACERIVNQLEVFAAEQGIQDICELIKGLEV